MKKILSLLTAIMLVGSSASAVNACSSNAFKNVLNYLINNKKINKNKETSGEAKGFYKVNLPNNTFTIKTPISITTNKTKFVDSVMTAAYKGLLDFFGANDKNWAYSTYLGQGGLALAPVVTGFWSTYSAAVSQQSSPANVYDWWTDESQPSQKKLLFTNPNSIAVVDSSLYGFTAANASKYNNGFLLYDAAPYVGPEIYEKVAAKFTQTPSTITIKWGSVLAYLYFNIYGSDNSKSQVYIPIDFSTTKLTFTLEKS